MRWDEAVNTNDKNTCTYSTYFEQLYKKMMSIKMGWGSKGRNPVAGVMVTEGFIEKAPFEQILEE